MTRLAHLLEGLERRGSADCLFSGGTWCTSAELYASIAEWRQHLTSMALEPGSVIGLRAEYSRDSIAFLLAAWAHRLVVALIPRAGDPEAFLADSFAKGSMTFAAHGEPVWLARGKSSDHPLLVSLRASGDAGVVIFTSGSTGRPKAALHGVERFLRKFDGARHAFRTLAFLQLDHVAGLDMLLYTLTAGGGLVLTPERDPHTVCRLIETARVEVLSASPSFFRLLWASGAAEGRDLSSVVIVTYGAEPMDAATLRRVNELFPGARASQKYGTTETGAPRTISRASDSLWIKIQSDSVETDIRNGILWIRSESQLLGYLNAPTPIDESGWYCTGDLVEQDGEWMRVLGREGELINVGGEKVSPGEVEHVILELDFVVAAAVSGRPHPLMGHVVAAAIALRPGVDPRQAEAAVRRHCRSRLPRHMVPITVEVSAESLITERQKVQRTRRR